MRGFHFPRWVFNILLLVFMAVLQLLWELETSNYPVACSYAARFAMSGYTNYHYIEARFLLARMVAHANAKHVWFSFTAITERWFVFCCPK